MLKWPIGRAGRGVMLMWLVMGSLGFGVLNWFVFHRLDPTINLGFRLSRFGNLPIWYYGLELLFDLALIAVAVARLHDIGKSGWWLAVIVAGALLASVTGSGAIGLLVFAVWLGLLLWPGTLGPNAFGADPKGWKSREQYETQMRELTEQAKPNRRSSADS
ncbi:DUF805 domain-containing protein [Allosphingosinicella humi]